MQKNIEVELKFQILNVKEIENFLKGLTFVSKKPNLDRYLDTQDAQLYKKGIFIRIRNKKLDFKFNPLDWKNPDEYSDHSHCDEYSFRLPLAKSALPEINKALVLLKLNKIKTPSVEVLRESNKFVESVIIDKFRTKYKDKNFKYSYDEVKDLGKFLEIETFAQRRDDLEGIKNKMRKRLKNLKLKYISTGYNELYWRKHDFQTYLTGRFLLEEDYPKYRPTLK